MAVSDEYERAGMMGARAMATNDDYGHGAIAFRIDRP